MLRKEGWEHKDGGSRYKYVTYLHLSALKQVQQEAVGAYYATRADRERSLPGPP